MKRTRVGRFAKGTLVVAYSRGVVHAAGPVVAQVQGGAYVILDARTGMKLYGHLPEEVVSLTYWLQGLKTEAGPSQIPLEGKEKFKVWDAAWAVYLKKIESPPSDWARLPEQEVYVGKSPLLAELYGPVAAGRALRRPGRK